MARKFIVRNRRKRKTIITMLLITIFMIGVGYSTLSTNLTIGGNLGIAKSKCQTENKLYNVLKCAVEDGLALEYTGAHQDSMDASNSTEKIYHWYAEDNVLADNTLTDQILDSNNVIFANHCWQMIRTTDTGGVKMIYNGEVEDGKCLNTRGTHVGYASRTLLNLSSNYFYGTDYTYDSTNKVFSISGTTEQTTWNATTGPTLIGKYTCKGTTADATCETLYFVDSYYSTVSAYVTTLNSNSHYSQFGTIRYSEGSNSPAYVGYMFGNVYSFTIYTGIVSQSFTTKYTVLSSTSFADTYQYSKTINDTGSSYSLVDPILGSSIPEDSYIGYYTYRSASATSGLSPYYLVAKNGTGTNYYYVRLTSSKKLADFNMMIGDSLTDNGNGTFTINNTVSVTPTDWSLNYENYNQKYTCGDSTTITCTNPRHITDTTISTYSYFNVGETITISKNRNGLILTDPITITIEDWYNNYNTYSDYKYTCNSTSTTCTEANLSMITAYNATGYNYTENHYYGSSVAWNGTNYTLVDPIEMENYNNVNNLSTHHYMCISNGLKSCSQVAYVYYYDGSKKYYYILLKDGVEDVNQALEEMLTNNTKDSLIKQGVDAWYKHYMLPYDEYLEDTIFCNDRSINSLGGWDPNGGTITGSSSYLLFKEYNATKDISCEKETDKFSVSNNNAKLTYKVGLMSNSEINLLTSRRLKRTGQSYWVMSAYDFYYSSAGNRLIGGTDSSSNSRMVTSADGARFAISLMPETEYTSGDGSMENPYIVKTN